MNAASTSSFPVEGLAADIDHRKKRRNRTTHSCINCHTTKRKCDRKRPCSRCTQLGLTGLCVYEVDDPTVADDPNVDELTRLRKRIAELEGVIRELKNKPHPRWATQASSETPASFHTRSQHSRLVKKRKLENGEELYELDGAGGPSSVKLEGGHEFFSLDGHYTMSDSFRVGSDDAFSSPVSVRSADSPPITPVGCECLTNTAAYNALGDLDNYLRAAINTLAAVRHSPTSPDAPPPASPDERCAIYAEMARLQDLIALSTRSATLAALPQQQQQQVPQISQPSPPSHGRGGPLSVSVPLEFQASIAQGVPDSFNLRPPPPGGASAHYSAASSAPHTPNGLITPPLSSHSGTTSAHPWDSYSNGASSPSPGLMGPPDAGHQHHVSSPALSATSSGTASTGYAAAVIPTTVQHELERDALNSLAAMGSYGQHQHQHQHQHSQHQQPQFYAPQQTPHYAAAHDYDMTPSARSSFDSSYDFCGHAQHPQHNAYVLRATAY